MIKVHKEKVLIDDKYIKNNTVSNIISPIIQDISIYEGEEKYLSDLSKFSQEQVYVYAIKLYDLEVSNGGHRQFFNNSTGMVYEELLKGLKELNANDYYKIALEACKRMEDGLSRLIETRQHFLEVAQPVFTDLDTKYFNLDKKSVLDDLLKDYILENSQRFYFEGIIEISDFDPKKFFKDFIKSRKS